MSNRNNGPQDNNLEALFSAQAEERKKEKAVNQKEKEKDVVREKELIKKVDSMIKPLSKTNLLLGDIDKNQTANSRALQSEISKNNNLLAESITNTKRMCNMLEKALDPNKKQPKVVLKGSTGSGPAPKNSFDDKLKHEKSILGTNDGVTPVLQSIKSDTSEIVKLLKEKNKSDKLPQKNNNNGLTMPSGKALMSLLLPLIAGVGAVKNPEIANALKTAFGLAKTGTTAINPIATALKAGSTIAGVSKGTAIASNLKDGFKGPANLGTMGKIAAGAGAGATIGRAIEGDTFGASLQGLSTALPLLLSKTKYGKLATLASTGIDVGLMGRDYVKSKSGDSSTEESNPIVQNTAETNKILEEIRDGKGGGILQSASSFAPAIGALGLGAMMMKGKGIALPNLKDVGTKAVGSGVKGAGKLGAKLLPGAGLALGTYGAVTKMGDGDFIGAALEGGSGIASLFPGIGTAIAIGLQGISMTRDAMKASSSKSLSAIDDTNTNITKAMIESNNENNDAIKSSNQTTNASIISASTLTNKSITDSSKIANDSLASSSEQLKTTGVTLSDTLMKASSSILGMIGKFSLSGVFGSSSAPPPQANSHQQGFGDKLHSSRKNNMVGVYDAFIKAGMNDNQARIMTAEIGRENSFGNNLWKTHKDDKNGRTNVGMMSWQNGRDKKLLAHLKKRGVLNPDGSIQRTQQALDAQAEFVMIEMRGDYKGVGNKFLNNKNISYQDGSKVLGKDYIKWAYDNPKYASGHTNRDKFYGDINSELYKRGKNPNQKKKTYISKAKFDQLSKAEAKPAMMASTKIHADWKKRDDARRKELNTIQKGITSGTHVIGSAPKETTSIPYKSGGVSNNKQKDSETKNPNAPQSNSNFLELGLKNTVISGGVDMAGLTKECREAFFTMIGELFATKRPRSKPVVTSAYRSPAKQKQLWDAKLKEVGGDESKARKWVAPPGRSKHEKGIALDVDYKQGATVRLLEQTGLLKKYNFSRPLSHEPWHIEFGSGGISGAVAGALGAIADGDTFQDLSTTLAGAGTALTAGLSAILSSDAMESIRGFMKGGPVDPPKQKYKPPTTASGHFTKDESDPTKALPMKSGNGVFWENLDQQLGNGTLQRQERNEDYEKYKRAIGGGDGIFRQMGGKHGGWLGDVIGGLFGGDDVLSEVVGVLTGYKDISGLPKVLSKSIKGQNSELDQIGVINGGFGGALQNANLSYDDTMNRYEDSQYQQAKQYHEKAEAEKMKLSVNIPQSTPTPLATAPQGGKSSQKGLSSQIFTRNPDSIIQQVAVAYLRSST